nr:head maturation protease, ClpP-related [uncultured Bacteroides sp.]
MKKFFNVIPGTEAACVLLYGVIGDSGWEGQQSSADIVRELMELESEYKNIDFRINSEGGEVYSGIAIINAIRNSNANITMYIDGIAASIASVIALCGKPLKMSKYAQLMIHSVQGGAYGTASDLSEVINNIKSLEDTLAQMIADKCGKPKEDIISMYFDGKDHWLTAQQAYDMGLVDEIYDVEEPLPAYVNTPKQIYTIFQNRLITSQKNKQMFEDLRKRPSFANCADDAAVLQHIAVLEEGAAKVPDLENEITDLKGKITVFLNKAKEAEEAEIKTIVDTAIAEERFTEKQRPTYTALLKADRTNGQAAIESLKPKKRVMTNLHQPEEGGKGAWTARMEEIANKNK